MDRGNLLGNERNMFNNGFDLQEGLQTLAG